MHPVVHTPTRHSPALHGLVTQPCESHDEMDMTALARSLIEPVPAHRTAGIRVLRAAAGTATVAMDTPVELANVIASLHSSGLIALIDAAGLAAIIAGSDAPADVEGVLPLGRSAALEFRAPARGRLVATCSLNEDARASLADLFARRADRVRFATVTDVMDASSTVVCTGEFRWTVRRTGAAAAERITADPPAALA